MAKQCGVDTIVEAIIVWGIETDSDDHFQEEFYDDQTFEILNIFVSTVFNFSNVFEVEFEQIFSKHCNQNMSEERFLNFLEPRIKILGELGGYFGYILPCVFVREIIYRFKSNFGCFPFAALSRKCLTKLLERKLTEFEMDNWNGLLEYCIDINEKFNELLETEGSTSSNERSADDSTEETLNITENADPDSKTQVENHANELFSPDKMANATTDKLNSEEVGVKDACICNVHISCGINGNDDYFDDISLTRANSNKIFDLSKGISEIYLKAKKEKIEIFERDNIADVYQSNIDVVSEDVFQMAEDEICKMYDILLPDFEGRIKVFNLIEKCDDFLERSQ